MDYKIFRGTVIFFSPKEKHIEMTNKLQTRFTEAITISGTLNLYNRMIIVSPIMSTFVYEN